MITSQAFDKMLHQGRARMGRISTNLFLEKLAKADHVSRASFYSGGPSCHVAYDSDRRLLGSVTEKDAAGLCSSLANGQTYLDGLRIGPAQFRPGCIVTWRTMFNEYRTGRYVAPDGHDYLMLQAQNGLVLVERAAVA